MGPTRNKVEKLIKELAGAVQVCTMYNLSHNLTQKSIDKVFDVLKDTLVEVDEITIGILGNEIAFEKEPFYETSQQLARFIQHLKEIHADKIGFLKNASKEDLTEFINILAMNAAKIEQTGGIEKVFKKSTIKNIALGKIGYKKKEEKLNDDDPIRVSKRAFQEGEEALKDVAESILNNKKINVENVRNFVTSIIDNLLMNKSSILALTAVKQHDEYSFIHNINVAIFSLLQAESLGIEDKYLNEIGTVSLLHDVGKLQIPGEILRKKGKLTNEEFKIIQSHPIYGAKMLLQNLNINPLAALLAFEHHVKYDSSGYPERLFSAKPNVLTMIVTISDVYDALRSKRAYAGEIAPEKTYEEMMRMAGKQFHPDLLNNFFHIIGIYPPGTLVELDTGEIGLVIKENMLDKERPQVEILYDRKGKINTSPIIASLIEKDAKSDGYKRTILHSITPSEKFTVPNKYK